ncbi:110aa long hypothetical protein [Pyrococcus horikoshii OT3]|uniref:Uncharacterized protein n=1 Tax=Pyrococcus horikoshii (strain ATCC 700860 / DSM 12428 / JCM 9974 / NBRC 100139 / OT-3) TaxID=70601 RepID=O59036_PYRHO|nr:110aa long hypothetical protein [Pyrococcus horikoshii OT3]
MYWITTSTSPMSIPSSIEDVHIKAFILPSLSFLSASILASFERLPWCTSTGFPQVFSLCPKISANCLVFTKINAFLYFSTISHKVLSLVATSPGTLSFSASSWSSGFGWG